MSHIDTGRLKTALMRRDPSIAAVRSRRKDIIQDHGRQLRSADRTISNARRRGI